MRQRRFAPLLVLCGALVAGPAAAEIYTVTLTNGAVIESRYQPRQAAWDSSMIELLGEVGNWLALPKTLVSGITALSETKGFGRVLDTTTIDLGFAPNDLPLETAGQASPGMTPLEQAFSRNYDIQQFVEPGAVGGGIPVFGVGAAGGSSAPAVPLPPPVPAPAPLAPVPPAN
jgi:hypothetical protein